MVTSINKPLMVDHDSYRGCRSIFRSICRSLYRSIVDRYSANSRSTDDRYPGQLSTEGPPPLSVDVSTVILSVAYQLTISRLSVAYRSRIGRISAAYRSTHRPIYVCIQKCKIRSMDSDG